MYYLQNTLGNSVILVKYLREQYIFNKIHHHDLVLPVKYARKQCITGIIY